MRSDCVLIQQASGPYKELLELALPHHLAYVKRHGMDYWPIFGEARDAGYALHPYWDKVALINQAFDAGYERVIWLDSDALIIGDDDLREAMPQDGIGAVWHSLDWGDSQLYDHFNAGVIYLSGKQSEDFAYRWYGNAMMDGGNDHPWHDQHVLNEMAKREPGIVQEIDKRWHSTYPYQMSDDLPGIQVMAWHGYGNIATRKAAMQACLMTLQNPQMVNALTTEQQQIDIGLLAQKYQRAGEYDKALALFHTIMKQSRQSSVLMQLVGSCWLGKGQYGYAEGYFREAIGHDPANTDAMRQLGAVLSHTGREGESVELLRRALEMAPTSPFVNWNMAIAELRAGNPEGFLRRKWGFVTDPPQRHLRTVACPVWDGKPIPGATLFVWAEEGFGDTMQFIRLLADAKRQSQARIVCEVQPALVTLLCGCPYAEIVAQPPVDTPSRDGVLPCNPDAHICLLELPCVLEGFAERDLGADVPYLLHEEMRRPADDIRAVLSKEEGLRVGICWQGNPGHANDRLRSIPMEQLGRPLLDVEGVHLVSLQQGHDDFGGLTNWVDTAAIIEHLDLVITVDTAVAHLAGAMGKEVWILLAVGADWRWGLDRETSAWYPTSRLFRQTKFGEWGDVVQRVACELTKRVSENTPLIVAAEE